MVTCGAILMGGESPEAEPTSSRHRSTVRTFPGHVLGPHEIPPSFNTRYVRHGLSHPLPAISV